jgi:shikimate dehydrogenase
VNDPDPIDSDYVVIGNPVAHSLSPTIHARFAAQTGERLRYGRLLADPEAFETAVAAFFAGGGLGANVTVPFKEAAAAWVQKLTPAAGRAGAVNTIVCTGGVHQGLNTDGEGLVLDLRRLLGDALGGLRVLVIGAGGAVRGILEPLLGLGPESLIVSNRTTGRAEALAERFAGLGPTGTLLAVPLHALAGPFDLIINGTSAGLRGEVPALAPALARGAFCYDLVYGAATPFCRWAADAGAAGHADGIGMLVEQAALAFEAWRGKRPDTAPVLAELTDARSRGLSH